MERVAFFFDGFNIYHSLDEQIQYHKYKWLDYCKLAEAFTTKSQEIVSVFYFTAHQKWKPDSYERHKTYIKALKTTPIKIVMGKYKRTTEYCKKCNKIYKGHKEKQTDVNIAVKILKGALLNEYDKAILATADTDLLPVIRELKAIPSPKIIGILFPIGKKRYSADLEIEADYTMKIKEMHLAGCQFPEEITIGDEIIRRPSCWV